MMLTDFDLCHTQAKMPILLFQKNQKYQVKKERKKERKLEYNEYRGKKAQIEVLYKLK